MTFKIERTAGGESTTIKIVGRIGEEQVGELKAQVGVAGRSGVLDLEEVSLVGVEMIRFLSERELRGIRLLNCSSLIRTWIDREREADGAPKRKHRKRSRGTTREEPPRKKLRLPAIDGKRRWPIPLRRDR